MKRIYLLLIYVFCWGLLSAQWRIDEIPGGHTSSLSHTGEVMAVGFIDHVKVYGSISYSSTTAQIGSDILFADTPLVAISGDGNRVGIIGETLAIARIYDLVNGDWVQVGTDISFTNGGTHHNSISLSPDGNRIALGGATNTVQVYELMAGDWTQMGSNINGENTSDRFGTSVALSANGSILAVGAPHNNNANGAFAGHVRVFEWSENSWMQIGIDLDGVYADEEFGTSVALSDDGTRLVAGAPYYTGRSTLDSMGVLRIFDYIESEWSMEPYGEIEGLRRGNKFGYYVDVSADGSKITGVAPAPTIYDNEYVGFYQLFQRLGYPYYEWKGLRTFASNEEEDFSKLTMSGNGNRVGFTRVSNDESSIYIYDGFIFLPIQLTTFQAKIQHKTTLLTWQTATETHNAGFEIQRSKDASTWEKIAWQDGQGDAQTPHDYTYRDENPLSGISYYRLKQIDFDGTSSHSDIVKVEYESSSLSIYPNPVKNTLHIADLNDNTIQNITIFDQMGRQVIRQNTNTNTLNVSTLPSGIYIIQVTLDKGVFSDRFIVK